MKLVKEQYNPLLFRKRIDFQVDGSITPTREAAKKMLAEKLKVGEELIAIKQVRQSYGRHTADCLAYVYDNAEAFGVMERKKDGKKTKTKK